MIFNTLSSRGACALLCLGVLAWPLPGAAEEVCLARLLVHADRYAPAILVARARLGLGKARVTAAAPLLPEDPELELSVGPRLSPAGQTVELEVSLSQRLEIAGERGLRVAAAERAGERLEAELQRTKWRVHQQVHARFHEALVARQRLAAARHLEVFTRQLLAISRKQHAAGAIAMLHVKVAQGEVVQAEQQVLAAEGAYLEAKLELAELTGWQGVSPPEPAGELSALRRAPDPEKLAALALARHPDLLVSAAVVKQVEAQEKVSQREVAPKPLLGVSYSREAEAGGDTSHVVLGTLGFSIPLWQRNQGGRAQARAEVAVARAEDDKARRQLRARIARAAVALDTAARRVEAYGQSVVPVFKQNLEMIGRAFSEGKVDVLQVMVARGRFLTTQKAALDARESYYRAHAELESMVGAEIWEPLAGEEAKR